MTNKAQETWLNNVVGKYIDVDGAYGYQCKDVIDSYCQAMFGNWIDTIRPNNAKDCFDGCNPDYFDRLAQNWNDPNWKPIRGDIIVYGASPAVPEGHIAVVESANNESITVLQQDGYSQTPTERRVLAYILPNGAKCIGWLRPKVKQDQPKPEPPKFMTMDVPRVMLASTGLRKFNPDTKSFLSDVSLDKGDFRLFLSKVEVDGKVYVRTEHDHKAGNRLGFLLDSLIDLPNASDVIKKLKNL